MPSDTKARVSIAAIDGKQLTGRALTVNESRPREDGGSRGGRGGSGSGCGGYGSGGGSRRYQD